MSPTAKAESAERTPSPAPVNMDMWDTNINFVPDVYRQMVSPHLDLAGRTVLDFGSGLGVKTLGLALNTPAAKVIGVDIRNPLSGLRETYEGTGDSRAYPEGLSFSRIEPGAKLEFEEPVGSIFSWSVFEHIRRDLIPGILDNHREILADDGVIFLQINPLYYSPHGSHLNSLIDEPWAHLLHQDSILKDTLYAKTKRTGHTGINAALAAGAPLTDQMKAGLWNCYRTLNKLTLPDLERFIEGAGFEIVEKQAGQTKHEPPARLLDVYREDVLCTEAVRLVFRKRENFVRPAPAKMKNASSLSSLLPWKSSKI